MLTEDLFEGWLSVPAFEGMLGTEASNQRQIASIYFAENHTQENIRGSANEQRRNKVSHLLPSGTTFIDPTARKRRGHTKSRLGCISCKKRKIKCQETWPSCANCIKRGCTCRYQTVFKHTQHDRIVSEVLSTPRRYIRVSESPMHSVYNSNDMRLFHHYMIAAHPCIPHEYEAVWVTNIPMFSHQYEYLMHGMLAMAGSHLDMYTDDPRGSTALLHRQKAIEGLEESFTRWPPSPHEAHVMLATSYLLAFQSSYMPDGFLDHILSLRGCALLSQLIFTNQMEGAFSVNPNMHGTWFEWKMKNFPTFDQELAQEALHCIAELAPHLASKASDIERAIVAQLVGILRPLLMPTNFLGSQKESTANASAFAFTPACSGSSVAPETLYVALVKNPLFPAELALRFEDVTSWEKIMEVPAGQRPDPHRSFNALMCSLLILTTWPRDQVIALFSPSNIAGSVVMAYFCCVRFLTSPLTAPDSALRTPMKAMVEWCEKLVDTVEDDGEVEWTKYVQWPKKILTTMRCCLNQANGLTLGYLYDALIRDPAAFREGRPVKLGSL